MNTKFQKTNEKCIHEIETVQQFLKKSHDLRNCTFQAVNFARLNINWKSLKIDESTSFLGCVLSIDEEMYLRKCQAIVLTAPDYLPYKPFRNNLYSCSELLEGYSPEKDESIDKKIYEHFEKDKYNPPINEALWQRIHDHAMDDALRELLGYDEDGFTEKKAVGFMGGHSTLRTDPFFEKTAFTAKLLAEAGYFIVSGGGPGIMEATNLGAYFAGRTAEDLQNALKILQKAPSYKDADYYPLALEVIQKYPDGTPSLAIPTWFYGHEPSNLFATAIAKYFSNSIREDTLLAISLYGIVCAPGSAGTTQEIFMDATQNHYGTFNYYSPMVFLGKERYEKETMIYPLLKQLAKPTKYYGMLFLTDEPQEVLAFLKENPPIKIN